MRKVTIIATITINDTIAPSLYQRFRCSTFRSSASVFARCRRSRSARSSANVCALCSTNRPFTSTLPASWDSRGAVEALFCLSAARCEAALVSVLRLHNSPTLSATKGGNCGCSGWENLIASSSRFLVLSTAEHVAPPTAVGDLRKMSVPPPYSLVCMSCLLYHDKWELELFTHVRVNHPSVSSEVLRVEHTLRALQDCHGRQVCKIDFDPYALMSSAALRPSTWLETSMSECGTNPVLT